MSDIGSGFKLGYASGFHPIQQSSTENEGVIREQRNSDAVLACFRGQFVRLASIVGCQIRSDSG